MQRKSRTYKKAPYIPPTHFSILEPQNTRILFKSETSINGFEGSKLMKRIVGFAKMTKVNRKFLRAKMFLRNQFATEFSNAHFLKHKNMDQRELF